jgi:hypothetical protein
MVPSILFGVCNPLPVNQEKMVWLIDLGRTMANAMPIMIAQETVNILQNHYHQQVGHCFLESQAC